MTIHGSQLDSDSNKPNKSSLLPRYLMICGIRVNFVKCDNGVVVVFYYQISSFRDS